MRIVMIVMIVMMTVIMILKMVIVIPRPPASNDNETRTEKGAEEAFPTTGIPNTAHNYYFGPNGVADPMQCNRI